MVAEDIEGYPTREDRIVAEFGDGFDVDGIAFRHGLTVAQVYAVVVREVGGAGQSRLDPASPAPPAAYVPSGHTGQWQGFPGAWGYVDEDAIVAEYGEGRDVEEIARRHGIDVERVYQVVQRVVGGESPAGR